MLFNSYEFLFAYLPIVFIIFFTAGKKNKSFAAGLLGAASLIFYAWLSLKALPLLLGSILINYFLGLKLSTQQKKSLLIFSLIFNLGLLCFFKYANFFIDNTQFIYQIIGVPYLGITSLDITLPIGISFFTFTQIAFLIDCYQGKSQEKNFIHYLLFVTYFPHLIAGPVLHHAQMMPQFSNKETYRLNYENIALGITIFSLGLGKKILLANPLSEYADSFFNNLTANALPSFNNAWLATLAYTFQIYFDFSGYTDMAIGVSLLFGITLPINFNAPYRSINVIEFWRRWHISLSTFLRDYLYIPLGGNHNGKAKRYLNLMTTMLLGGLWHGANWTFVLWGCAHGLLLIINHSWQSSTIHTHFKSCIFKMLFWGLTFIAICLTWVIFRVDHAHQILPVYEGLLGLNGFESVKADWGFSAHLKPSQLYTLLGFSLIIIIFGIPSHQIKETLVTQHKKFSALPIRLKYYGMSLGLFLFVMYCINQVGRYSPFLYFQF